MWNRGICAFALLCLVLAPLPSLGRDLKRCAGRVLQVGDVESEAERLCGRPFYVDAWQEYRYIELDDVRRLRQRIDWRARYFDPGPGHLVFRVLARQGRIVAIDTLNRRGGPAQSGDCTLAALERAQSVGEVVHRCGLPEQRIDLGQTLVSGRDLPEVLRDLRHERWLYPAHGARRLELELREGELVAAGWR
jgi:hypothetical protein